MPTTELGPPRWVLRLLAASAVVVLFGVGAFMVVTGAHNVRVNNQIRDLEIAQQRFSARSDCRASYSAVRQDMIESAQEAGRQSVLDVVGYLLGNPVADTPTLLRDRVALEAAEAKVTALPTLELMVEKGATVGSVRYPPCPRVTP